MEHLVPEPVLAEQFDRLQAAFARRAAAGHESWYTFAGRPVRMQIAGECLAQQIARPFLHLRRSGAIEDGVRLDIRLWDEREPGSQAEPPRLAVSDPDGVTEVAVTGRFVQQRMPHFTISLDRKVGQIVGVFASSPRMDVYRHGKPLARLLAEWYADEGVAVMHAALVARGEHGVLLAGRGGSGKSTSAYVCARAGLGFLGDDYAGLQFLDGGVVVGHSAYNSLFLNPETTAWFPELRPHLVQGDDLAEPKGAVLLADLWPDRVRTTVHVRAIALCRVTTGETCVVRPATPARALLAIGPSSLLEIHGRRRDSLERLARLVESVPCFHLDLGRDFASVPAAVDEVIRQVVPA